MTLSPPLLIVAAIRYYGSLPLTGTAWDEHLKDVHFDNRQFNFLRWKVDDLATFTISLAARIEAIFGKGPVKLDPGRRWDARQSKAETPVFREGEEEWKTLGAFLAG